MDGLFLSQIASLEAPQSEMDSVSKKGGQIQASQVANEAVFLKALDDSMKEVNELIHTETEDTLSKEKEDDEEQNQEE